jgi:hypothetical protein
MRSTLPWSTLFALTALGCGVQDADVTGAENQMSISQDAQLPAGQRVAVASLSCSIENGNYVVTDGALDLGDVTVQFEFRNNEAGTHSASQTATIDLGEIRLTDGLRASAIEGDDAYVWMQLLDAQNRPLSDEVFLGSCGAAEGSVETVAPIAARALVTATTYNCGDGARATLNVASALQLEDMKVRFIFRETDDASDPIVATVDSTTKLSMTSHPQQISLPKQPSRGGVGGNPWIYAQFLDAVARPVGDQLLLGRCKVGEP